MFDVARFATELSRAFLSRTGNLKTGTPSAVIPVRSAMSIVRRVTGDLRDGLAKAVPFVVVLVSNALVFSSDRLNWVGAGELPVAGGRLLAVIQD
jgi:hypothetical protein